MSNPALNYHQLLNCSLRLGTLLLENGAEVYRVEESMTRMLAAYGVRKIEVFAVPAVIIVSFETPEYKTLTKVKRIKNRGTNFERVSRTNDYIRYVCNETPALAAVLSEIEKIKSDRIYGRPVILAGAWLVGFSFTLLFRGSIADALVAGVAVVIARFLSMVMEHYKANTFFITLVASFIHTVIAGLSILWIPGLHMDKIITGTLMILVPGVAFLNALRDLIARDLVAGMIGGLEALLYASAIAIGGLVGLWLIREGMMLL